uniref:Inhibitor I9 domain-containing protein n=1 Tax=Lotus japonicus TaxID=34305 RepID=I3T1H5_LOTJA|nr:unknown [Lotus japonicus]
MGNSYLAHLVVLLSFLGMLLTPSSCQDDSDEYDATTAVYIVTLKQAPTSHNQDALTRVIGHHFRNGVSRRNRHHRTRYLIPSIIFILKLYRVSFQSFWVRPKYPPPTTITNSFAEGAHTKRVTAGHMFSFIAMSEDQTLT